MQKNSFVLAVLMLLVGFGVGYLVNSKTVSPQNEQSAQSMHGMHRMPDGSMMGNSEDTMSMSQMMAEMNDALRGKKGQDFDRAFLAEMIVHHEGAVEMAKMAQSNADKQEIKDLSDEIISAQEREISQMKQWEREWFEN